MSKKDRDLQGELKKSAHKIWLAGLGALAVAEEEGSKLFKSLVKRGEEFEAGRGKHDEQRAKYTADRARRKAEKVWERIEEGFDEKLAHAMERIGAPTRKEINELAKRVEKLRTSIERLSKAPKTGAKKRTKKPR